LLKLKQETIKYISEKEFSEILRKLKKDDYVFSAHGETNPSYYLTFEGRLFLRKGGYEKGLERETAYTKRQNSDRIINIINILAIIVLTVLIFLADIGYFNQPSIAMI
jgi:hypothetical protein